jgi:hypothetical protein
MMYVSANENAASLNLRRYTEDSTRGPVPNVDLFFILQVCGFWCVVFGFWFWVLGFGFSFPLATLAPSIL